MKEPVQISQPFGTHTFLDNLIHGIFGHDPEEYTPEKQKEIESDNARKRKDASAMATSAMKNPGQEFMGPPALSGNGASLGDIIRGVAGLFQGGPGI